jgi:hypothetical protein
MTFGYTIVYIFFIFDLTGLFLFVCLFVFVVVIVYHIYL